MAFARICSAIAAESTEGKVGQRQGAGADARRRAAELAEKTKALQANQQKLQQSGAVMNEAARAQPRRKSSGSTVEIERFQQDAQAEMKELQQQLQDEFQEKLLPIIDAAGQGDWPSGLLFSAGDAGVDLRRSGARPHGRSHQEVRRGASRGGAKPRRAATAKPRGASRRRQRRQRRLRPRRPHGAGCASAKP